jgi:uncharacterized protein (TIGR02284 family)
MNNRSADVLNDLLKVARDGERFYRDASEKVSSPVLKGIFRQMAEVRQRLMDELAEQIAARGEEPTPDQTLRGASRQAYAEVLATLRTDYEQVYLGQLDAVEDRLLDRYERALTKARTESVRQIVRRHLLTVRAAHDRMKALKDQSVAA